MTAAAIASARVRTTVVTTVAKVAVTLSITGAIVWGIWLAYFVAAEFYMLGTPGGTPFTHVARTMRFDVLGRFLVVPALTWVYWHIVLRPHDHDAFTGADLIALAVGAGIACVTGKLWYLGGVSA